MNGSVARDWGASRIEISVLPDRAAVARAAVERFVAVAQAALAARGTFAVALSGGSTPRDLYGLLACEPWKGEVDWRRTHLFWGDERCVPPDHPQSNYRLAREVLLDRIPTAPENVHRLKAERPDRQAAAKAYADEIARFVPVDDGGIPRFDLMLLGLGSDGHTASLLPGSALVHEQRQIVAVSDREREGIIRLTVTPPVLRHAAVLLFVVTGEDKAAALREVLEGEEHAGRYPAQVVRQAQGDVVWLVDGAAAARLSDRLAVASGDTGHTSRASTADLAE
jgi:6-phosphogluconolactonase